MDDDRAAVRFVDRLASEARARRASDIHLEPYAGGARLRLRVDGVLQTLPTPEPALMHRAIARLKVLAGMDVAEKRLPQDGRVALGPTHESARHFRVATCPGVEGEKLVLRVIEGTASLSLDELEMPAAARGPLDDALTRGDGLVLVTGPTGSGKSATLHAALASLDTQRLNLCTVEDPVERTVPGATQVAVNRRAGLDFATALRGFLRQDPDVLMVGEIRDAETADIAVKAAQTGHLVLSTLHTRSAEGAVERLLQMGVEAYDLASSLRIVLAQRLVRRLCPHCSAPEHSGEGASGSRRAVGCAHCDEGFRGRQAVFQALPVTTTVERALLHGGMEEAAREAGSEPLWEAGQRLLEQGRTSACELRRVLAAPA